MVVVASAKCHLLACGFMNLCEFFVRRFITMDCGIEKRDDLWVASVRGFCVKSPILKSFKSRNMIPIYHAYVVLLSPLRPTRGGDRVRRN